MNNSLIIRPKDAVKSLPNTDRYKVRYKVKSESSNSLYLISFDAAPGAGYWTCSCRGCIAHGQCKHLTAAGLKGRKFGKDLATIKLLEQQKR
jgi:hypothetical protein